MGRVGLWHVGKMGTCEDLPRPRVEPMRSAWRLLTLTRTGGRLSSQSGSIPSTSLKRT